jgi:UDP-N-acetylmuramate dehydrogenase
MPIPSHFQQHKRLGPLTTFGIGGEARYFVEVRTIEEMQETLKICHCEQLPFFILGKGSNSLFDDRGFNGVVIANRIDFLEKKENGVFRMGAGYSFSLLGAQTARQGWEGLEFASGIPGSVGGAVYMNAGANGRETCNSLVSVEFVNEQGELAVLSRSQIEFSYRFSSFQKQKGAIVAATFALNYSPSAREKQLEIINYRKKTQPYKDKSAGCIFRNPSCGHAGALIDQSGLKGKSIGGAQVSTMHANFIINKNQATSGIELESEVRCVPYQIKEEK